MSQISSSFRACPACHGPLMRVSMPTLLRPLRLLLPAATAHRCGWRCGWSGLKLRS